MSRAGELVAARELAVNLTLRELRGMYRRSFLGWGWSLLNPVLSVAVYWVVFGYFLNVTPPTGDPSGLDVFVLFLVCGIIPWKFFSQALDNSLEVLITNSNLISKVYFPREILVIGAVNALIIAFVIELGVVCLLMLIAGNMVLPWIPALLLVTALTYCLVLGISLLLSVLNVYFRDLKHLSKVVLQAAFYSAPIVYPIRFVPQRADIFGWNAPIRDIYELNPLVAMIECFRNVLYDLRFPDLADIGYLAAWAMGALALGWFVFLKLDRRLAEEV